MGVLGWALLIEYVLHLHRLHLASPAIPEQVRCRGWQRPCSKPAEQRGKSEVT